MRHAVPATAIVLFGLALAACEPSAPRPTPDQEARRDFIRQQEEKGKLPGEARDRMERSLARLRAEGVPVNGTLPVIATESESKRRSAREVAGRALALALVATRADGATREQAASLIREYGAEPFFSPAERRFLASPSPPERDRLLMSWRYEDYCVLLWALGYVDTLERPEKQCDVSRAVRVITSRGGDGFIRDARLRPQRELLDAADLVYRYDWALVDARVTGKPAPAGLSPDVVMERHQVLNWLVGYMDEEWDDISTDT
jgi:hypothetical protein